MKMVRIRKTKTTINHHNLWLNAMIQQPLHSNLLRKFFYTRMKTSNLSLRIAIHQTLLRILHLQQMVKSQFCKQQRNNTSLILRMESEHRRLAYQKVLIILILRCYMTSRIMYSIALNMLMLTQDQRRLQFQTLRRVVSATDSLKNTYLTELRILNKPYMEKNNFLLTESYNQISLT